MKAKGSAYWMAHVAAIKREAISTSAYAKRHGIAAKSLYYWQSKSKATAANAVPIRASHPKTFVAIRVAEPNVVQSGPTSCTLVLDSGMRLEMSTLPAPAWLAALGRAAQGAS